MLLHRDFFKKTNYYNTRNHKSLNSLFSYAKVGNEINFTSVWNCYAKIQTIPNLAMKMMKYKYENSQLAKLSGRGGDGKYKHYMLPSLKMMFGGGDRVSMMSSYIGRSSFTLHFHMYRMSSTENLPFLVEFISPT